MLAFPQSGCWLSLCLVVGAIVIVPDFVLARTDFSAGKTSEQLFSSDCSHCHRSANGLAHGRRATALTAFLREHYTTNAQTAGLLASYVIRGRPSNGAVHPTANLYLTIFWTTWRKVCMACQSLLWRVRQHLYS